MSVAANKRIVMRPAVRNKDVLPEATPDNAKKTEKSILAGEYREIPLNLIDPCKEPVRRVENWLLEELGMSIKNDGLYAPLLVRPKPNGRFMVTAGGHRYESILQDYRKLHEQELANFSKNQTPPPLVPCIVRELSDDEAKLVSIAENTQRNDRLDAITEGQVFSQLVGRGWTPEQILKRIGKKQLPYVTNRILIATKLHESLKSKVRYGQLNVLDAVRIAGFPLSNQLGEHRQMGIRKHGALNKAEKCNHRCPRHCP